MEDSIIKTKNSYFYNGSKVFNNFCNHVGIGNHALNTFYHPFLVIRIKYAIGTVSKKAHQTSRGIIQQDQKTNKQEKANRVKLDWMFKKYFHNRFTINHNSNIKRLVKHTYDYGKIAKSKTSVKQGIDYTKQSFGGKKIKRNVVAMLNSKNLKRDKISYIRNRKVYKNPDNLIFSRDCRGYGRNQNGNSRVIIVDERSKAANEVEGVAGIIRNVGKTVSTAAGDVVDTAIEITENLRSSGSNNNR